MEQPLHITLELEPRSDPITGRLYAHGCAQHSFHGRLAFAAALESAREEGSARSSKRR